MCENPHATRSGWIFLPLNSKLTTDTPLKAFNHFYVRSRVPTLADQIFITSDVFPKLVGMVDLK
jgi:hypothetical protein